MPGIKGLRRSSIEDRQRIGVKQMHDGGVLQEGVRATFSWSKRDGTECGMGLAYRDDNLVMHYQLIRESKEPEPVVIILPVEWTPCFYGGHRPWFHCPDCKRRCLFVYAHFTRYTCRRCVGLPYHSQGSTSFDRAAERANRIRERLGWEGGFLNGMSIRPKGMHRKRFVRLVRLHNYFSDLSISRLPFPIDGFGYEGPYQHDDATMMAGKSDYYPVRKQKGK